MAAVVMNTGLNSPSKGFEEVMSSFNMNELRTNLPQNKRGLSRYYSGKSQSFTCLSEVRSVDDLKKQQAPDAKKRKKYTSSTSSSTTNMFDRQGGTHQGSMVPPRLPCRRIASSNHCSALAVGV